MNSFLKKTAAFIAAGLMATASLGIESFADSAKLNQTKVELQLAAAVAKPTYTVKGTPGVRKVRLSTATAGATIYYTTNGTVPTTSSRVYNGTLIKLTSDTKIKAIAVKGGVSSAVMTKTFYIKTMVGDVTGDHQINQNDYSRLKNFIAGKTKYICTDNADCNGSGGISSKDLTVLGQYLNGTINTLPSKTTTSSVKKPTATMRKVYGGMQITFAPKTAGSTVYYTTDGSTPTTSSTRYSSPFTVTSSSQIQAIAYLNGEESGVFSFSTTVGTLSSVQADKPTTTKYSGEITVALTNNSSAARIIYTLDGSDPRTSNTASFYTGPIKLSNSTTIKAFAQAKGYEDSWVSDFTYNIENIFTISGIVWDDTPVDATSSNGVMANTEAGIQGIPVYLITSTTDVKDAPSYYVQKTTTDSYGKYSFSNLSPDISYKVVFEYNCQKYRAYNAIMNGGNQALAYTTIGPLVIRNNGAYTKTASGEVFSNTVSKYSEAVNSVFYKMYAVTNRTYTSTATDVNLGLISKNYGILDLSISVTGQDTTNNTVKNGKKLVYNVKVTNNSPLALTTLEQCSIEIVIKNVFGDVFNSPSKTNTSTLDASDMNGGYKRFVWYDFIPSAGLAPGKSAELQLEGYVDLSDPDEKIEVDCYAQVISYRFAPNCYDYYSIPGNMTNNKVKERDEAAATVITAYSTGSSSSSSKANMIVAPTSLELHRTANTIGTFYVSIINGSGTETLQVVHNDGGIVSVGTPKLYSNAGGITQYSIEIKAIAGGIDAFKLQLIDGSTILKTQELMVNVRT